MYKRVFILCGFLVVLGGCVYDDEPMPKITHDYSLEKPISRPVIPKPRTEEMPTGWLPAPQMEKQWSAIVIHHSGTNNGNVAIFDRWHRQGNHWEGVGYDFVIGNGTNSADGQVEVTYRWRNQQTGAHCGGTAGNWANEEAIGICLVGNFDQTSPTPRQMQSLVKLIRFLQKRYGIPKSRVYGHNTTPGANATDCPGKKFPMAKLKLLLER
jgi:N-acetylmuramoyl-L-alanine amidase